MTYSPPCPGVEYIDRSRVVHELHAHEGGPPDPAQEAADPFLPQTRPEPDAAGARMPPVGATTRTRSPTPPHEPAAHVQASTATDRGPHLDLRTMRAARAW
jgi:hypothetical protein